MLYTWIIATRPWSFTAALIPITLGSALAWVGMLQQYSESSFHPLLFLLTLMGGVFLQAGTNLLNTYGDYMSGVDTVESAKTCPQIVKGVIPAYKMKQAGISMFVFAIAIGWILYTLSGWPVLFFGCIGLLGAATYTTGWFPYKYKGLGPAFVFLLMGPCMVLPAYYVQTGRLIWEPFFAGLPIAFLVTAIMHANDLRDIEHDKEAHIKTVAIWLGLKQSLIVYKLLCFGAYCSLVLVVSFGFVPVTALLPFVLFPSLYSELKKLKYTGSKAPLGLLEGWSARFHFLFGILFTIGVLLWGIGKELL